VRFPYCLQWRLDKTSIALSLPLLSLIRFDSSIVMAAGTGVKFAPVPRAASVLLCFLFWRLLWIEGLSEVSVGALRSPPPTLVAAAAGSDPKRDAAGVDGGALDMTGTCRGLLFR